MPRPFDVRLLIGLLGVLIAAVLGEFNDQVASIALTDVRGALGISADPGTWLSSLYISAEVIGMTLSYWLAVTFSPRRFILFVIGLSVTSTVPIPLTTNIDLLYVLRTIQGLAEGLTIPLLMGTALRATPPSIRLYGLAMYALTSTVTPGVSAALAALWVDAAGWRFVFLEAIPLAAMAAVLAWHGLPQDAPHHERLRLFDWRGAMLIVAGFGSLTTLLQQGDRLDWFNSPLIQVLAAISVFAIPLLFINEWFHQIPLLKPQLLGQRNFAYATIGLFAVTIISLSGGQIPLTFLTQVQGYRPIQTYPILLEIAGLQVVMLPLMAVVLNVKWVDARVVSFIGLALILAACLGDAQVTAQWNLDQFWLWQALQGIGQPMFVVSLLLIVTNGVRPADAPFATVLINTPRALAEAVGAWLLALITRWRGGLHVNRLLDQAGQVRFQVIQAPGLLPGNQPPLLPNGQPRIPGSLQLFGDAIQRQATVLTLGDAFLIMVALTVALMVLLLVLPVRSYPPRIALATK